MSDSKTVLKRALAAIDSLTARLAVSEARDRAPIAVVGLACRIPGGVTTPQGYWELLRDGRSGIRDVPPDRWDVDAWYDPDPRAVGKAYTKRGGFLDQVDGFDAAFFGISPREALTLDPQHRLLLECAWEALEDAGEAPDRLVNSATGVYVGITTSDYARLLAQRGEDSDVYSASGTALNAAAGRISFALGLQGPCMAVDTACSSSLTATHLAVQALRGGECDLALAGGVNVMASPEPFVLFSRWGMVSASGECRTFDAGADGFVRGEGCGVLALKRLDDAVADGNRVLAVIRGSAVNQDGPSSGLSVPNGLAQIRVLREALSNAGVSPREVGFVETHGTGTILGDPIEVEALGEVYGEGRPPESPLLLGSVKPSIGHLESAAGAAGLLKLVLALHHGEVPPQRNFETPNPRIDWDRYPFEVPTERRPWGEPGGPVGAAARDAAEDAKGRRVGAVSGFGFSGTNVHIVMESAPSPREVTAGEREVYLLPLSAKTDPALREQAGRLASALTVPRAPGMADVAHTLAVGRAHLACRGFVVAKDREGAVSRLEQLAQGNDTPGAYAHGPCHGPPAKVAFLFTGQGSQYAGMGNELRREFPVFREALDRCAEVVREQGGPDLYRVLADTEEGASIHQTAHTQPCIVAVQYAMTELFRSWGVVPAGLLGHSVGEITAAAVAGVLDIDDALRLVAERGRLMQGLPPGGGMLAVAADAGTARAAAEPFSDRVSLAALNGPADVVLSGETKALAAMAARLGAEGVDTRPLTVSHAFHSPLMDPMLEAFEAFARTINHSSPGLPLVSNVTGTLDPPSGWDAAYWRRHVREPVCYEKSLRHLAKQGFNVFLEIGPRPVLVGMGRRFLEGEALSWVPTLRGRGREGEEVLEALGRLFALGVRPDWEGVLEGVGHPVALPTYPFQRRRHWVEEGNLARRRGGEPPEAAEDHPLLGRRVASPSRDTLFECVLDPRRRPLLNDHRVAGQVLVPAAAFIEMGRAAGEQVLGGAVRLEAGWFRTPLILPDDPSVQVRLVASPAEGGGAGFELFSRARGEEAPWVRHAGGTLGPADPEAPEPDSEPAFERCTRPVDVAAYQEEMRSVGLEYGASFLGLEEAFQGEGEATGIIRVPPLEGWVERLAVHPGILDAAFHLIGLALSGDPGGHFYLPVGYDSAQVRLPVGPEARAHATVQVVGGGSVLADVTLWREDGRCAVRIEGLRARRVTRQQFMAAVGADRADLLLRMSWREAPPAPTEEGTAWQVVGGGEALSRAVATRLREEGAEAEVVDPEARVASDGWFVDLRLLDPALALALDADLPASEKIAASLKGTLELIGAMASGSPHPGPGVRLVLPTRGGQGVLPDDTVDPVASAAWGLGLTAAAEVPSLTVRLLDLDNETDLPATIARVAIRGDRENRLAARAGTLRVPRLLPLETPDDERFSLPAGPYRLVIQERGSLDGLAIEPFAPPAPEPGYVEIEVLASGLNFRDVLNLLGMYPGEAGSPGNECSGRISRLGEGVTGLAVGDLVSCIAEDTFASHVQARASLTFPVPPGLSISQAATFPIAQLTAWLALHDVGGIRDGSRVLVHAAAGGVGLAAVHLALAAGADVVASAGSKEKRDYLLGLGVREVLDSRNPAPLAELRAASGGDGFDLILNSLTGEFIDRGILSLAPGGRFLEIGLREMRSEEEVKALRTDVSYHPLLLGDVCRDDPESVGRMYAAVCRLLDKGEIPPPRTRSCPVADVGAAFRFMARARHMGRIAVVHPWGQRLCARQDSAYLITGGLGALGLEVAEWLVGQGAGRILLMGRSAPSEEAETRIRKIRSTGVEVEVIQRDASRPGALSSLSSANGRPLRGIVHAAGIVDDAVLSRVDAEQLARAAVPKADAALNLLSAVDPSGLDFLVFFSSGSAVLGSPGQAAYATANAFLDGLAQRLIRDGVRVVSVDWGAWEVGMAQSLDARTLREWKERGVGRLTVAEGLTMLERSLAAGRAQVAALPMDWSRFLGALPPGADAPFLEELSDPGPHSSAGAHSSPPQGPSLRSELESLSPRERATRMSRILRQEIATVLGISDPAEVDAQAGLMEQGMDSLMTVDLATRVGRIVGVTLPSTFAFEHPTLAALAHHLLQTFEPADLSPIAASPSDPIDAPPPAEVEGMSDAELAAELRRELDSAGF